MAEKLGKFEKPEADRFAGKRKLYLVPLIFSGEKAPAEYVDKFNLYWEQAGEHIARLEAQTGKVEHIYHETVTLAGEEGLKAVERLNPAGGRIARDRCQCGAVMEITETGEVVEECMDWERCLLMGFISQKAARKVSELYIEASKQRYEGIARRIDETLKDGKAGLLFIREGHRVQFPPDIEVFSVVPPALDEIRRWQREQAAEESAGSGK